MGFGPAQVSSLGPQSTQRVEPVLDPLQLTFTVDAHELLSRLD